MRRGALTDLPSGEAVARALGVPPLEPAAIALPGWSGETPLFYYVAREADTLGEGDRLGPVGGRIVGGVLMSLLDRDPASYRRLEPDYRPPRDLPRRGVPDRGARGRATRTGFTSSTTATASTSATGCCTPSARRSTTVRRPPESGTPKSEIYYGADCFGVVATDVPQYTDEMKRSDFGDGYLCMNRANHVWFENVRPEALAAAADKIKKLGAKMLVSGHVRDGQAHLRHAGHRAAGPGRPTRKCSSRQRNNRYEPTAAARRRGRAGDSAPPRAASRRWLVPSPQSACDHFGPRVPSNFFVRLSQQSM